MTELKPKPSPATPEEAATRAVDQDALLAGENPESPHLDDAEHWVSVYTELIDFKAGLLATSAEHIADFDHEESRGEAKHVDLTILRAELERCRRRLAFWKERLQQLRADGRS